MQTILFAMALAVANPGASDHQAHAQHKAHAEHSEHADHAKHDCKAHCEEMKQAGKEKECMEKHQAHHASGDHADHSAHGDDSQ